MKMQNKKIQDKIRALREAEELGRGGFSKLTGIPTRTIESIEIKGSDPRASYLCNICSIFPEYSLWLITDEINIDIGQISPMIKTIWNTYTLDNYPVEDFETLGIEWTPENEAEKESMDGMITKLEFDRFNTVHLAFLINLMKDHDDEITDAKNTTGMFL